MNRPSPDRLLLAVAGVALAAYGAVELLGTGWSNVAASLPWLLGVVVVHDAVLTPLVLGLGAAGALLLPRWARAPAGFVVVVLGSVTLIAVPVLGRFGAKPDNPSLLDRPYLTGWLLVAGIVVVGSAAVALARRRREGGGRG